VISQDLESIAAALHRSIVNHDEALARRALQNLHATIEHQKQFEAVSRVLGQPQEKFRFEPSAIPATAGAVVVPFPGARA
jgi:plastocyanin